GHSIGDRTALLMHYAGKYLSPKSEQMCKVINSNDFELKSTVVYPTKNGNHVIKYTEEGPVLTFVQGGR
ncbi:MAG: hypothetical protein EBT92_09575, partial [Planctomycetes bacterium]|nr:hypothetical protein [Planctomycetota bacterium]